LPITFSEVWHRGKDSSLIFNKFDNMHTLPDCRIHSEGIISTHFRNSGISTFAEAALYIKNLPYGRNADKENLETIFTDGCGTCSTKHAILKLLAEENDMDGLDLKLGIFRMNAENSPKTGPVLEKYGLKYIPEAHNYLYYNGNIIDITFPGNTFLDFVPELLDEMTIIPNQITTFKVARHKDFIVKWLNENPAIKYTPEELWNIRERCIAALSAKTL
jgi:hypothetical protein